jgi:predicted ArsR family transcriptional regulator
MSDTSKNFSLRLSADDQFRLEQIAERLAVDRTGALRLLIRRAAVGLARDGRFTAVERGRAGREIPVRLIERGADDRL